MVDSAIPRPEASATELGLISLLCRTMCGFANVFLNFLFSLIQRPSLVVHIANSISCNNSSTPGIV
jgi:hypothetical protein